MPVGNKRKRVWIPDEKSARVKHEMLLAMKLRKLEEERDLLDNPKPGPVSIAIPRKKGATSASTPSVADAHDRVSSLLQEVERQKNETARLHCVFVKQKNMASPRRVFVKQKNMASP